MLYISGHSDIKKEGPFPPLDTEDDIPAECADKGVRITTLDTDDWIVIKSSAEGN